MSLVERRVIEVAPEWFSEGGERTVERTEVVNGTERMEVVNGTVVERSEDGSFVGVDEQGLS